MSWTTLLDPALTRSYGFGPEAHAAWFTPGKCPAPPRDVITLLIPECEIQFVILGAPNVLINRPRHNRSVSHWLKYACREARDQGAILILACDTAGQVEHAVKLAGKLLPRHHRTALERIYSEQSRTGLH
ncbi:hypothetical protein [Bradyrhizobium sp. AZCC 2230]|uniref:hypothetical protein n=1 Tax=Bradyrhizobium sp. AZCC 2230 TaxID=3117021 RepID=UPI002FEF4F5E